MTGKPRWYRYALTVFLTVFVSLISAHGQNSLVGVVFDAILTSSSEIHTYRDIPIDWKMKGRAQAAFNEGLDNLVQDNASLAVTNFNIAIAEDNSFWEVYYYRGIAYKKLKKYREAKEDFKFLIDGDKERYFSQIELGKIAFIQRDFDESDRYFNRAIRVRENNALAHYMKANNQMMRGADKAAINSYRDCLNKDSTMYDALIRLALISSSKKLTDGFVYLDIVLRHDSLNANALLLRGLTRIVDNRKLAIRDFNNLLIKDPNMLIGRYLRGIAYSDLNDFDRAFTDFQRLVESTASDDNAFTGKQSWIDKKIDIQNLGTYTVSRVYGLPDGEGTALKKAYCLLVSGRADECARVVDGLVIVDTEPLCAYLKAVALEHTGKHKQAFELYNKAVLLDKDIPDAYKKRGIYYQELKMWDKSIADFTTLLKHRPNTLIAMKQRGLSYLNTNHFPLALADFNQYLHIDSTDMEVLSYRGLTYIKQHEVLLGSVDYVNAKRVDAVDSREVSHAVDSIVSAGGDTLKVIAALNVITKKAPQFTDVYAKKMRLLVSMGEWDQIAREIDAAVAHKNAPKSELSYLLTVKGMVKGRTKNYDEAIDILSDAIDADKTNALAFLERGKLHAHVGKSSKAISDLNKAKSLGSNDAGEVLASVKAER
jgi:tetratricopeptide (TPR) repeat protein